MPAFAGMTMEGSNVFSTSVIPARGGDPRKSAAVADASTVQRLCTADSKKI
jgi:hypothetical protein